MEEKKLIDLSEAYTSKLLAISDKYENKILNSRLSQAIKHEFKLTKSITTLHEKLLQAGGQVSYFLSKSYTWILTNELTYKIARYTSFPFNWLWYLFLKSRGKKVLPIFENGTHFGYALQGGGKSSLAYNLMESLRLQTGLGSYINVELEKPRYDSINQIHYKLHQVFDETEFWGLKELQDNLGNQYLESTQLKKFDTKKFRNVFIDELFSLFNQRENKKSSYNNVFIGLMKSIVHQRHADIDRYYFFSQIDKTDVQLESIFKWVHQIKVELDTSYLEWVKTGKLVKHIIGWHITSTTKDKNRKGQDIIRTKKYFIPRIFEEEYFETKNMKHLYDHLPLSHVKVVKGQVYE